MPFVFFANFFFAGNEELTAEGACRRATSAAGLFDMLSMFSEKDDDAAFYRHLPVAMTRFIPGALRQMQNTARGGWPVTATARVVVINVS